MAVPEGDSGAIAAPAVGARVLLFGKHLATVRYVGAVDGQAGQWVGIEYDDPSAGGKHDGSHAGRRYFSTSQPTAGSLVKLPKFLEAADLGRSLVAAARERYGGGNGDSGTDGGDDNGQAVSSTQQQGRKLRQQLYLPSSSGSRKIAVEVVAPAAGPAAAARRQSAGDSGVAAALVAHGISSVVRQGPHVCHSALSRGLVRTPTALTPTAAPQWPLPICSATALLTETSACCLVIPPSPQGDAEALRKALPSLTELDLSDNLIPSWSFVAELAHALPELRTLNLSGNRLALPGMPGGPAAWELPQAESGSGHSGAMGRVPASLAPPSVASLAGLRCLVLNSCRVSWPQAVALGQQLPNLQELHLCSNGIASLALPAEGLQGAAQGPAGEQAAATAGSEQAAAAAGSKQQAAGSGQAAATAGSGQTEGAAGSEQAGGAAGSGQAADTRPDGPTGALLAAAFPRLHLLDLDDNELSSWADLAPLGALPTLRTLALSGTRLAAVAYTGGGLCTLGRHLRTERSTRQLGDTSTCWSCTCTSPRNPGSPRSDVRRRRPCRLPCAAQPSAGRLPPWRLGLGRPTGPLPRPGGGPTVGQPADSGRARRDAVPVHRTRQVWGATRAAGLAGLCGTLSYGAPPPGLRRSFRRLGSCASLAAASSTCEPGGAAIACPAPTPAHTPVTAATTTASLPRP